MASGQPENEGRLVDFLKAIDGMEQERGQFLDRARDLERVSEPLIAANLYDASDGPKAALRGIEEKLVRDRDARNRKVARACLGG